MVDNEADIEVPNEDASENSMKPKGKDESNATEDSKKLYQLNERIDNADLASHPVDPVLDKFLAAIYERQSLEKEHDPEDEKEAEAVFLKVHDPSHTKTSFVAEIIAMDVELDDNSPEEVFSDGTDINYQLL